MSDVFVFIWMFIISSSLLCCLCLNLTVYLFPCVLYIHLYISLNTWNSIKLDCILRRKTLSCCLQVWCDECALLSEIEYKIERDSFAGFSNDVSMLFTAQHARSGCRALGFFHSVFSPQGATKCYTKKLWFRAKIFFCVLTPGFVAQLLSR